jgi:hypothetical protein
MAELPFEKINHYKIYIHDNINELKLNHRREILQMIKYANIDDDKIVEKGSGTQIKFSEISVELLHQIYNFIYTKIEISADII